jgi:Na+(H+)/acetate symporter ActP
VDRVVAGFVARGGEAVFAIVAGVTITTVLAVLAGLAIAASGAVILVVLGPDVLGEDRAIFPLSIPAIVSVPAGFLCAYLGSLAGRGRQAATGMPYDEFVQRVPGARGARLGRWRSSSDRSGPPRRSDAGLRLAASGE